MNAHISIERRRVDCNSLPKGWQREEVLKKSGISAGKVDVYYYSPTGKRIDSKPQLARYLGESIDVNNFDFQKGKFVHHLPVPSISVYRCSGNSTNVNQHINNSNSLKRKQRSNFSTASATGITNQNSVLNACSGTTITNTTHLKQQQQQQQQQHYQQQHQHHQLLECSRNLRPDASLIPPIRQTASIFKQPVTLIRNHENNKVKHDSKHGVQEKPKQLFWEKRLERVRACHMNGENIDEFSLPKGLKPLGPNIHEQTVLQSLATALHILTTPVTGQTATKTEFQKNAAAYINPDQPLMQAIIISDEDIRRQDDRVNLARRKLQEALKA